MNTETPPPESDADPPKSRTALPRTLLWFGIPILALLVAGSALLVGRTDPERLLEEGYAALACGESVLAFDLAEQALRRRPNASAALLLAAEACEQLERFAPAVEFYDRVSNDDRRSAVRARCAAGELLLFRTFRLSAAEDRFRKALQSDAGNLTAHSGLAFILGMSSRAREAVRHRLFVIGAGRIDATQLYLIAAGDAAIENPELLGKYGEAAPDDPLPKLGSARYACELKDYRRAAALLREVTEAHPHLIEAQAWLGETLLQLRLDDEFAAWNAALPEAALDHPRVWLVRGEWAARQGEMNGAIRCYWEAVRRDANSQSALYQLGQALVSAGSTNDAEAFLSRAALLAEYLKAAELVRNVGEISDFQDAASRAESLGLLWEAYGWSLAAGSQYRTRVPWAKQAVERLAPELARMPLTRTSAASNPAEGFPGASFALPSWTAPERTFESEVNQPRPESRVTFWDRAANAGLDFQYFNGGDPNSKGLVHMYEVVGGGVAVIDFDQDGWPDVYFPQGGHWPPKPDQTEFTDRLFRNQGDGRFGDVTAASAIQQGGFGQGVTVGDFNADGFGDIFIANIGPNRLLTNNGDGTFTDVTDEAGITGDEYTTSCLLADLNGDALPDLYAANYLSGADLFSRVCGDAAKPRSCLPQAFDACPDRLFVNTGDGRFEDATATSGIAVPQPGKALGTLAADLDASGRLSLYVANDVGPNFLFVNQTQHAGGVPRFVESGLLAGVALNGAGNLESGMGIAAGDVDNDGRLDLFVTNFDNETNTLYQQTGDMLFADRTGPAGLGQKTGAWVGWGAQFIDGELDGLCDLILTNGHVNDVRDHGKPFQMPPQYFSNIGAGRFVERAAEELGPRFQAAALGRGMARIDWNRDGREDVLITHLDVPAALLTNTTSARGRHFKCRLVGVRSSRDAIGTTVTVECGDQAWSKQLTAGDGNQSSNERVLVFGLGDAELITQVEVRWPSGTVDRYRDPPCDSELVIVEGRADMLRLPQP